MELAQGWDGELIKEGTVHARSHRTIARLGDLELIESTSRGPPSRFGRDHDDRRRWGFHTRTYGFLAPSKIDLERNHLDHLGRPYYLDYLEYLGQVDLEEDLPNG